MADKTMRAMLRGLMNTGVKKEWVMTSPWSSCAGCWSQLPVGGTRRISTFGVAMKKRDSISSGDFMENRNSLGLSDKRFGKYEKVTPREVSEYLVVPDEIKRPEYVHRVDGVPKPMPRKIGIKTDEEIKQMRETCRLARYVLERTLIECKPGVTTDQLDKFAHNMIVGHEAYPSTLGYRKYPKSVCTSVNNVACHGIPDSRKLISGDIITLDVMAYKNGFHGDCAGTKIIGEVDEPGKLLVSIAEECTMAGINVCGPGVPFREIGKVIEAHASSKGFSVVSCFTGHGIGRNVHEKPDIYHYDKDDVNKDVMKPGMIFTIEPVITQGMELIMILSDGWTAVTVDGARTAQFENTILITKDSYEILTDCSFTTIM